VHKLYTKDNCVKSKAVKMILNSKMVEYEEISVESLSDIPVNLEVESTPVFIPDGAEESDCIIGFLPEKYKQFIDGFI